MNILGKTNAELVLELAELKNSVKLDRNAIAITGFTNVSGIAGVDAQVTIVSADPSVYYRQQTLQYGKVDLNKQWAQQALTLPLAANASSYSILDALKARYGLWLSQSDVVLTYVNTQTTPWELHLQTRTSSLAFKNPTGDIVIKNSGTVNDLQYVIKRRLLTGLNYPSADQTRIQGPIFTYRVYAPSAAVTLARYSAGYVMLIPGDDDWATADVLSGGTNQTWAFNQTGFTLYNAQVLYNGSTQSCPDTYHVNRSLPHVLILKLAPVGGVGGYVTIHY